MATYAIKWDEKILVTEENKNLLVWYKFIQEEIPKKEKLKIEYKNIQKAITDIKSELQEIDDTYETYNDIGKTIADKQKTILSEKLTSFRQQKDLLVLWAIEAYWEDILNEL